MPRKKKSMSMLSISMNQDNQLSFKGAIDKTFKLNNNRKRVHIYDVQTMEKLFTINVKPTKDDKEIYVIDLEEGVKEAIISLDKMTTKFGDVQFIGLGDTVNEIKTSTVIINKQED